jgi:hypothetical protein
LPKYLTWIQLFKTQSLQSQVFSFALTQQFQQTANLGNEQLDPREMEQYQLEIMASLLRIVMSRADALDPVPILAIAGFQLCAHPTVPANG